MKAVPAETDIRLELEHMTRAIIEISTELKGGSMDQRAYNFGIVKGYLIGMGAPVAILEALEAAIAASPADRIEISGTRVSLPVEPVQLPLPDAALEQPETLQKSVGTIVGESPATADARMEDDGRGWPQWKKQNLIELKAANKTPREIAAALGKTSGQVSSMWHYMQKHRRDEAIVQPKPGEPVSAYDPEADADAIGKRHQPAVDTEQESAVGPAAARKGWRKGRPYFTPPPTPPLKGETTTYVDEQGRKITKLPPGYARGVTPNQTVMPSSGG